VESLPPSHVLRHLAAGRNWPAAAWINPPETSEKSAASADRPSRDTDLRQRIRFNHIELNENTTYRSTIGGPTQYNPIFYIIIFHL